ncbi:hypothetical protein AB5J62_24815 [Amycolatopsis sp. cg5]|uniref:hypothetical protein n=1 Tax=Amycolatopsis sp. cg5 TaxID=3238802 RepID=UPI003526BB67
MLGKTGGAVLAVLGIFAVNAPAASASLGKVTVFELETNKLTVYRNPDGCNKLPPAAHVLVNQTSDVVRIYGAPFCLGPSLPVSPDYGSHVAAGSGSFSVR